MNINYEMPDHIYADSDCSVIMPENNGAGRYKHGHPLE
jgi:hypothetical protein